MAKKRLGGKPGDAGPEAEEEEELAREIGRLQKRAREIERAKPRKPIPREAPRRLFSGGAKESSELEDADEPFRAADIMRSRVQKMDEGGETEHYKRGPKKGQPKFKHYGTVRERNEDKLAKHVGKQVRVIVKFDKLKRGGLQQESLRRTRTIRYENYDDLVNAYQDLMRQEIDDDSDAAYYVQSVDFATA